MGKDRARIGRDAACAWPQPWSSPCWRWPPASRSPPAAAAAIESGGGGRATSRRSKVSGKPSGDLTISNWPLYIDKSTVPDFEKATGVSVKYIEDVNDNQEFFGKLQPLLAKGESGGRSIFVVTDWMAKKMYDLGYLQNLDKAAIPNVEKNLVPDAAAPADRPQGRIRGPVAERDDRV